MCCDKFVEGLKDEVRESTSVRDVVQPSNARKNVVCFGCLNRVIKTRIRDKEANSNSPAEKSRVKKRARTHSGNGDSGVFDIISVLCEHPC